MKFSLAVAVAALMAFAALPEASGARALRSRVGEASQASGSRAGEAGDRTITRVVKLLRQMLDDSKKEGEQDRDLFAKHKCYCDDNTAAKTASIKALTKQIGLLENDIEQLQGSNARLSSESAQLQADMNANTQARTDADNLRQSAKAAFQAEESDLTAAVAQLGQAVDVLAAIGGDQSLQAAADHSNFMANYSGSLLNLRSSVKEALIAANTFLSAKEQSRADAFLQAPFTGAYAAQSSEIVGILKQMKATFESNLESARSAEKAAETAHTAFMSTKQKEFDTMKGSYDDKQQTLSSNDNTLSEKKNSLAQAVQQKADDEDFLAKLGATCAEKAKENEERNMLRTNEEAAIAEAIAILDSDSAFESFGKVAATSTGATSFFVQLSSVKRHEQTGRAGAAEAAQRRTVAHLLTQAARSRKSSRLARVAVLLEAGNPFDKVLKAIAEMKQVIVEEGKVDKEQFDWCDGERTSNNQNLQTKTTQIQKLEGDVTTLVQSIDDPTTGLKVMIDETETALVQNSDGQAQETETRRKENANYQEDVGNAVEAAALLQKAIAALEKYYAAQGAFVQADPAPPATWGNYTGQSTAGANVISMINFVLSETQKEEEAHHAAEHLAQTDYEDSMQLLKDMEKDLQANLVQYQKDLADAEKDLASKRDELDKTQQEKISIERYLAQIKPGCDFITDNFQDRETNRQTETAALDKAVTLLTASPAYVAAASAAKLLAFGPCESACAADEAHVDCKACMAKVSVPGYCAGHPGTPGC